MTYFYSLAMNKKPHWIPQHAFIAGLYPRNGFPSFSENLNRSELLFPSRNDSQTTQQFLSWRMNQAWTACAFLIFLLQNTRNVGVFWQEGLLELCLKPSSSAINIKVTMWKLLQDIPLCGQCCRLDAPSEVTGRIFKHKWRILFETNTNILLQVTRILKWDRKTATVFFLFPSLSLSPKSRAENEVIWCDPRSV